MPDHPPEGPLEPRACACQAGGMSDTETIARMRISLLEIMPEIWRRVEVPANAHLKGLHDVIQAVFGWQD